MKVVLDTNVLISGIGRSSGAPGEIMSAWVEDKFDLVVSEPLPEKIERALQYPKVRKLLLRAGVSDDDVRDYLDILRIKALNVSADNTVLSISPRGERNAASRARNVISPEDAASLKAEAENQRAMIARLRRINNVDTCVGSV